MGQLSDILEVPSIISLSIMRKQTKKHIDKSINKHMLQILPHMLISHTLHEYT